MFNAAIVINLNLEDFLQIEDSSREYEESELVFNIDVGKVILNKIIELVDNIGFYASISDCLDDYARYQTLSRTEKGSFLDEAGKTFRNLVDKNEVKLLHCSFNPTNYGDYEIYATINMDLDILIDKV